jgi:hypothetical protein
MKTKFPDSDFLGYDSVVWLLDTNILAKLPSHKKEVADSYTTPTRLHSVLTQKITI